MKKFALSCITLALSLNAYADNPLYETGPGQDSSFVRFLNAASDKASVVNGSAKVALGAQTDNRVSRFYPVKAGDKLSATVQVGNHKTAIDVVAKPGEFITIAIVNKGNALDSLIVRESPTDFNANRASISLLNADPACTAAGLNGGAKGASVFENVATGTTQRRLVNAVKLSVQAQCNKADTGAAVDMGQLQAGERYSVIVIPSKKAQQVFFVRDSTS
ncbi:MAG: hypothetical protein ACOYNW_11945 [Undibacterium curvum]|uniref:hypothetical protein n=1 Tax=Undibacterium curvum TaxID=2762294 RepID=UPI003BE924D1